MKKVNFREWTLDKIDEAFNTIQVPENALLTEWLNFDYTLSDYQKHFLTDLQEALLIGVDDWNEVELENKFISPLIVLAKFDNRKMSYFMERELSAVLNDFEVSGKVDGMIASGFRNPKKPYFCMTEYKRESDPTGDPRGQALIAMLVAQDLNSSENPVFGCYIVGKSWRFMVLEKNEYAISKSFSADDDEINDIFRIIKGLHEQINKLAN
jgi:hypothetical protein